MTSLTADAAAPEEKIAGNPWWTVVGSFLCLLLGSGTITYVFGVFLRPVTEDLGISRGVFSTGILVFTLVAAPACPFIGGAVDLWGVRKVLLPLITGFALCMAAFSLMGQNAWVIWGLFGLLGLVAVGLTPIAYARAISLRFDPHRGLALGIAIAGVGCGIAVVPPIVGQLVANWGWRTAYVAYGIAVFVIAFPAIFLIPDSAGERVARSRARAAATVAEIEGMTGVEAARSWRFWALLVAFFLAVVAVIGTITHTVPLLIDRGLPLAQAARTLSFVGLIALASRVGSGWLLDHFSGPKVAIAFFLLSAAGIYFILSGMNGAWPTIGAALLGLSVGAEVDMMAYFVGGYFGLRSFGRLYGLLFAAFSVGSGVGPFLSGMAFDRFHSYEQIFTVYIVLMLVACVLMSRLGPYPYPPRGRR